MALLSQLRIRTSRIIALLRKRFFTSKRWMTISLTACFLIFFLFLTFTCNLLSKSATHATTHFHQSNRNKDDFDWKAVKNSVKLWKSSPSSPATKHELWNKIKDDVVIGIKTGHEVAKDRLNILRTVGWWSVGRHVPNVVIIGDQQDSQLGVIDIKQYAKYLFMQSTHNTSNPNPVDASTLINQQEQQLFPNHWFEKSGWKGDKDKNLPAFHLMKTLYPNKKWYLLLDDDTYIFLENFARYTFQDDMNDRPIYTGKVFYISRCGGFSRDGSWIADKKQPKGTFAHGGSGIVLNHHAMDILYPRVKQCIRDFSSCWAGDIQVALCLRTGGVLARRHGPRKLYEKHFTPFWPSKALSDKRFSARWKSNEEPITFHKIPKQEQNLMSQLEKKAIESGDTIVYSDLKDHLLRNGIIPCWDDRNRKNKYFSREFFPKGWKW